MVYSNKKQTKGASQKVSNKKTNLRERKSNTVSRRLSKKRNPKKNKTVKTLRKKKGGSSISDKSISDILAGPNPTRNRTYTEVVEQVQKDETEKNCSELVKKAEEECQQRKEAYKAEVEKAKAEEAAACQQREAASKAKAEAACQKREKAYKAEAETAKAKAAAACQQREAASKAEAETACQQREAASKAKAEAACQQREEAYKAEAEEAYQQREAAYKAEAEKECQQREEAYKAEAEEFLNREMKEKKRVLSDFFFHFTKKACDSLDKKPEQLGVTHGMDPVDKIVQVMDYITLNLNSCKEERRQEALESKRRYEKGKEELEKLKNNQEKLKNNQEMEKLAEEEREQKRESNIKAATELLEKVLDLKSDEQLNWKHVLRDEASIRKEKEIKAAEAREGETKQNEKIERKVLCTSNQKNDCILMSYLFGKSYNFFSLYLNDDDSLSLHKNTEEVKINLRDINFMLPVKIEYPETDIDPNKIFGDPSLLEREPKPYYLFIINCLVDREKVSEYFIMNQNMSPFLKEFLKEKNTNFVNTITEDKDIKQLIHDGEVPVKIRLVLDRIKESQKGGGSFSHRSFKKSTCSRKFSKKKWARHY